MQHPHIVDSGRCRATLQLEQDTSDASLVHTTVNVSCDLQADHDGDHQGTAQVGPVGAPETRTVSWPPEDSQAV